MRLKVGVEVVESEGISTSGRGFALVRASIEIMEKWRRVEIVDAVEVCLERISELEREQEDVDESVAVGARGLSWVGSRVILEEVELTDIEDMGRCLGLVVKVAISGGPWEFDRDRTRSSSLEVSISHWAAEADVVLVS